MCLFGIMQNIVNALSYILHKCFNDCCFDYCNEINESKKLMLIFYKIYNRLLQKLKHHR